MADGRLRAGDKLDWRLEDRWHAPPKCEHTAATHQRRFASKWLDNGTGWAQTANMRGRRDILETQPTLVYGCINSPTKATPDPDPGSKVTGSKSAAIQGPPRTPPLTPPPYPNTLTPSPKPPAPPPHPNTYPPLPTPHHGTDEDGKQCLQVPHPEALHQQQQEGRGSTDQDATPQGHRPAGQQQDGNGTADDLCRDRQGFRGLGVWGRMGLQGGVGWGGVCNGRKKSCKGFARQDPAMGAPRLGFAHMQVLDGACHGAPNAASPPTLDVGPDDCYFSHEPQQHTGGGGEALPAVLRQVSAGHDAQLCRLHLQHVTLASAAAAGCGEARLVKSLPVLEPVL